MIIHIGERKTVSDKECIAILNLETLKQSSDNDWITGTLDDTVKTIALLNSGDSIGSKVSPFTIIKRSFEGYDSVWRRDT